MKRALFIIIQCTWGILQTIIGAVVFLAFADHPHRSYRCAVDTSWERSDGMSLGLFIFTPRGDNEYTEKLRVHEYGHSIQSLVLGPLYLIICIISVTWSNLPAFEELRRDKGVPYTACFVESWASRWGEWITGEKAFWD